MAFDFYFAGGMQSPKSDALKLKLNVNELRSYMTERKEIEKLIQLKKEGRWSGKLLVDSGAFTIHRKGGTIDMDQYCEWLNERKDYIDAAIQLDAIPGVWGTPRTKQELLQAPIDTWNNYLYMVERLVKPEMLLPVFHMGENFKYLTQICNHKINGKLIPYICISGNKELTNRSREKWYEQCFTIIKSSQNPNVKVHCLGSATFSNMEKFPFTSSDATSWIMTCANGGIITPYGMVIVSERQRNNKENLYNLSLECQNKIKQMCENYELNYEDLATSYETRLCFNVMYQYEQSQCTTFKPRKFMKGGLI